MSLNIYLLYMAFLTKPVHDYKQNMCHHIVDITMEGTLKLGVGIKVTVIGVVYRIIVKM